MKLTSLSSADLWRHLAVVSPDGAAFTTRRIQAAPLEPQRRARWRGFSARSSPRRQGASTGSRQAASSRARRPHRPTGPASDQVDELHADHAMWAGASQSSCAGGIDVSGLDGRAPSWSSW